MADAAAPPAAFTTTAEDAAPPGAAWLLARGLLSLAVPVFPAGSEVPFGPVPLQDVLLSLAVATAVCSAAGYYLTRCRALLRLRELLPRHADLRDEAFEDGAHLAAAGEPHEEGAASLEEAGCGGGAKRPRAPRRRTVAELLFISREPRAGGGSPRRAPASRGSWKK
ncbi:unnamed protein product [Prorocentrum cordatum]|uniref:Membrane magnesium transporter n=1 Tax=Prorocentrum cordatum TaxID=2364126 RepID=A0ABN9PRK8_9DINO|nr:unnamed protein product [Polarella glacialis]